jgi:hypothetical protein
MKTKKIIFGAALAAITALTASVAAEIIPYDRTVDYAQYIRRDNYIDVEIWTDNDEYYEGDKITVYFKANNDCFAAIYNIDTRGRVNLLFPSESGEAARIKGGRIYELPDRYDDYELTVQGPPGTEYLQIVASNDPFILPRWLDEGRLVCEDDPYDFMDYINASYFGCARNCVRALDMTSFVVKEWHNYYFRPIHHYHYPDWSVCGSIYIDYPFGATIYIDGVYWGIAPLFIPRVYFGYHYITIYDWNGYCWEDRINVVRYRSVILDDTIIRTRAGVKSRYREVSRRGFLDPVKNGYPDYHKEIRVKETYKAVSRQNLDYTSGKTRTAYKAKSSSDNDRSKGNGGSYQIHKTSRDGDNSSRKSRAAEYKVEKIKSASGATAQKKQSSSRSGDANVRSGSSQSTGKASNGDGKKRR